MFKRRYLISTLSLKYNLSPLKTKKIGFNGGKFKMAFVFYDEMCKYEFDFLENNRNKEVDGNLLLMNNYQYVK